MNYTIDTTTYNSFQKLTIGKSILLLPKKAIASIALDVDSVTVKFEDGTEQSESIGKSKTKNGSKVMDNRSRNWKRRSY